MSRGQNAKGARAKASAANVETAGTPTEAKADATPPAMDDVPKVDDNPTPRKNTS